MKAPYRLALSLICLITYTSVTKANNPALDDFEFLKITFENTTMVENGSTLSKNMVALSLLSTVNTAISWGACKIFVAIPGVVGKNSLGSSNQESVKAIKNNACLKAALLATTTETALAGHLSPWPLETLWWRPVFVVGGALAAYGSYKVFQKADIIPVTILAYLTIDSISQTSVSGSSTAILKHRKITEINEGSYRFVHNTSLSLVTAVVISAMAYEVLTIIGVSPIKAGSVSLLTAFISGALSEAFSVASIDLDNLTGKAKYGAAAATGVIAAIIALITPTFGLVMEYKDGSGSGSGGIIGGITGVISGSITVATALTIAAVVATDKDVGATNTGFIVTGSYVPAVLGTLLGGGAIIGTYKLSQINPALAAVATAASITAITLINSFSGYAIYGYPLEQSVSEAIQVQWEKFSAPDEYISRLFGPGHSPD